MAIVEQKRPALPGASRRRGPDRIPKERYFDPDVLPSSRPSGSGPGSGRWRAASRRSREPHDFAEYQILDQSIVVVRTEDPDTAIGVTAFQNACRHRGVKVAVGRGTLRERVHLPLPRVVLRPRRQEHRRPAPAHLLRAQPAGRRPRPHPSALRDLGRLRLDQPRPRRPAAAPVPRALRHQPRRLEGGVAAHRVVVRGPPARQLEARHRGVRRGLPRPPDPSPARDPDALRPAPGRDLRRRRLHRLRHPLPARHERGHGRHGPRRRRAHRRGPARGRAPRRARSGHGRLEPDAQRGGHAMASRPWRRHPRSERAGRPRAQRGVLPGLRQRRSCCRCTAAPRPTGSGRWARRRP